MSELGMKCDFSAENHFGPRVPTCRREFDFALLFEQDILGLGPDVLFLVLCPLRWYQIYAVLEEISRQSPERWKTVCFFLSHSVYHTRFTTPY